MAKKKELYAIGILFQGGKIKYVTSVEGHNWAKWEDGKEAMLFDKNWAVEMCRGFAWNGISGIPILKLDWINLENPPKAE